IKTLTRADRYSEAERACQAAHGCAPRFPYLNYLYGNSIYFHLGTRMEQGQPPELDELVKGLERARALIVVAQADPEIEGAAARVEEITSILAQLAECRREMEARRQEAKPVNEAIQEFVATQNLAKDGIQSPEHHEQVHQRMKALHARLPGLARQVK